MSKERIEELENILIIEGVNAKGFGTIPKLVMKDRRLTVQAKAIYSYFCSYAGGGSTAFPKVAQIMYDLNISNKTYYKHFELLTKYGYITVQKRKGEGNKFENNIYILNMNPKPKEEEKEVKEDQPEKIPPKEEKTVVENLHYGAENGTYPQENSKNCQKSVDNSHSVDFPSWKNSMTQNSMTRNYTTNINSNTINSFNNYNNNNSNTENDYDANKYYNWIDEILLEGM